MVSLSQVSIKNKIIILFFSAFIFLITSTSASSLWDYEKTHLKRLGVDGSLYYKLNLGQLNQVPEAAFNIELVHSMSGYAWDVHSQFSHWEVPQLTSYVVKFIEEQILWLSPSGDEIVFHRSPKVKYKIIDSIPRKLSDEWTVVNRENSDRIEIHSKDGWLYVYNFGQLEFLELPSSRRFYFKTNLTQITEIYIKSKSKKHVLLSARYDDYKRLSQLSIGPKWYTFEYFGTSPFLKALIPFGIIERATKFKYKKGFVSKISHPNKNTEDFMWHLNEQDIHKKNASKFYDFENDGILLKDSDFIYNISHQKKGIALSATDKLNNQEWLILNPIKNRLTRIDKGGLKHQISWKDDKNPAIKNKLAKVTAPNGDPIINLSYDNKGRVNRLLNRGEAPIYFSYDENDRLIESKRGAYPSTKYQFKNEQSEPYRITDPLGNSVDYDYNEYGDITSYTDENGARFSFQYDELGQLISRHFPLNVSMQLTRDVYGRIIEIEHSNGSHIKKTFDDLNQIVSVQENSISWDYNYDLKGRLISINRNGKLWKSYKFDEHKDFLTVQEINEGNHKTIKKYDLKGRILEETNPLGQTINYKYDAIGQLSGWKDQESGVLHFLYDANGNVVAQKNKLNQTIKRKYNSLGLLEKKDSTEQAIAIKYDQADRITRINFGNGQITQYQYDEYGRIKSIKKDQSTIEYSYNANDLIIKRKTTYQDDKTVIISYNYDPKGELVSLVTKHYDRHNKISDRITARYKYDQLGRLLKVYQNNRLIFENRFSDKKLVLKEKVFGNQMRDQYHYDDEDRLIKKTTVSENGEIVYETQYRWNHNDEIISKFKNYF